MYCATTLALFDFGSSSLKAELYAADGTVLEHRSCVTGLGLGSGPGQPLSLSGRIKTENIACRWAKEWKERGAALHFAGTEALRKAVDGQAFLSELAHRCGADWTLVSDTEEGLLGYRAWHAAHKGSWILVDLGGRSCEVTDEKGSRSIKYGVLSARRALEEGALYDQVVETFFSLLPVLPGPCVCSGGSASVLSNLIGPKQHLTVPNLEKLKQDMQALPANQRRALPAIPPGWEPNLFGALACQQALARRFGTLTPTDLGWRHGLARQLLQKE